MKKIAVCILIMLCLVVFLPIFAHAESGGEASVITATGQDVPTDDHLPEEYRFPAQYRDNAVQFRTSDGVLLCGYVLGEGSRGVTLGHPNGWMVKSWLPFAERLVNAGYMVILWEFRNIEPSGFAPESESRRWDLDVLAAAQVLRERGASEILAMGASDGGTATAIAAPDIPDLVGLGILSSPKDSVGNAVEAIGRIKDVPAFFAVSTKDSSGDFYPHMEALYEACASTQKQFIVEEGVDHGTDMITPEVPGLGYASLPTDDAQIKARQELSDKLLLFVNKAFAAASGPDGNEMSAPPSAPAGAETAVSSQASGNGETAAPASEESGGSSGNSGGPGAPIVPIVGGGLLLVLVAALCIVSARRRKR